MTFIMMDACFKQVSYFKADSHVARKCTLTADCLEGRNNRLGCNVMLYYSNYITRLLIVVKMFCGVVTHIDLLEEDKYFI